jgi:hypothetical protein
MPACAHCSREAVDALVVSAVGFAFAVVSAFGFSQGLIHKEEGDVGPSLAMLSGFGAFAAVLAGVAIRGRAARIILSVALSIAVILFAGASAACLLLVWQELHFNVTVVFLNYNPHPPWPYLASLTNFAIGLIAYLVAATSYGILGARAGVRLGSRIRLLTLLLLSVLPLLGVIGLAGFVWWSALGVPATHGTLSSMRLSAATPRAEVDGQSAE